MDFERKAELTGLLAEQDRDVTAMVSETELPAVLDQEPAAGSVSAQVSDRAKPDETALAAWVDDLREYERDHAGSSEAVEAADKLTSALLDDLGAQGRGRMSDDRTAADEQQGLVADFHADLMIEGAAMEVHEPDDNYLLHAAPREPSYIDSDYGGGGSGDGGGGASPPGDDAPAEPPPDKPRPPRRGGKAGGAGDR